MDAVAGRNASGYGEITPAGFRHLASHVVLSRDDVFFDLGSGVRERSPLAAHLPAQNQPASPRHFTGPTCATAARKTVPMNGLRAGRSAAAWCRPTSSGASAAPSASSSPPAATAAPSRPLPVPAPSGRPPPPPPSPSLKCVRAHMLAGAGLALGRFETARFREPHSLAAPPAPALHTPPSP